MKIFKEFLWVIVLAVFMVLGFYGVISFLNYRKVVSQRQEALRGRELAGLRPDTTPQPCASCGHLFAPFTGKMVRRESQFHKETLHYCREHAPAYDLTRESPDFRESDPSRFKMLAKFFVRGNVWVDGQEWVEVDINGKRHTCPVPQPCQTFHWEDIRWRDTWDRYPMATNKPYFTNDVQSQSNVVLTNLAWPSVRWITNAGYVRPK